MEEARLGPYRVLSELGAGSTAKVHLAEVVGRVANLEPGSRVALKILHPQFEATPKVLRRFHQEAKVGRALNHENIVRLLDAGTFLIHGNKRHYLAMEYVRGRTLRDLLEKEGVQQESLCRLIGCEAARGLGAVHADGIVHRDVKPENIVVSAGQTVMVMDLGIARMRDESISVSHSGDFVGSVLYAAPEQFRLKSDVLDGRADLYALGLTLYELVTGVHPFDGETIEEVMQLHLSGVAQSPSELNPQISPFFEYVLLKLLRKARAQRFTDAESLVRTLEEAEDSEWWHQRRRVMRKMSRRPLRRIRVPRSTAVHGRDEALSKLLGLWRRVKSGEGQTLLLVGEQGIGKSRLVDEFAGRLDAAGEDFHHLFGACPPSGPSTAAGALCTAYREHFGAENLEEAITPLLVDTPVLVRPFAAFLRGEPSPKGSEALRKDALHTLFVRVTHKLAQRHPTMVTLEDLDDAPAEGLAIVTDMAQAARTHRILLVATAGPDISASWMADLSRQPHITVLQLDRLGVDDVRGLLDEALSSERLAGVLAHRLTALSGGNPLFLFEVLQGLKESGVLLENAEHGGWSLEGTLEDVKAPPAMRDLVQARFAGAAEEDRELLDAAATYGFDFDPALLAEVLGRPRLTVLQQLGRLERTGRVVRTRGRRCTFDHRVLQEVLYEDLPRLLREEYHAAIGDALRRRCDTAKDAARRGADAVEACQHLLRANRGGAALPLVNTALDHLEEGYLSERAAGLMDSVLAVTGLVEGHDRAELLLRKAVRLRVLGDRRGEAATLEEAVQNASPKHEPLLASRAMARLGDHLRRAGHPDRALEFFERALTLARRAGSERTEARTLGAMGHALDELGRPAEAKEHQERYLAYACREGDRSLEAKARGNLAVVLFMMGQVEEANEEFRRSLSLFDDLGDLYQRGRAAGNLGHGLSALGRYEEARTYIEQSIETARLVGYRQGEAGALGNLGIVHLHLGNLSDAASCFEQGLAIQNECGTPAAIGLVLLNLGVAELCFGRLARSRVHLEDALAMFRETGNRRGEAHAIGGLADVALAQDRDVDAQTLIQDAVAIHREMGALHAAVGIPLARTRMLIWRGQDDMARADLASAADAVAENGDPDTKLLFHASRAALGGEGSEYARADLAARGATIAYATRLEVHALLWRGSGEPADLREAWNLLDAQRDSVPEDAREVFMQDALLHRILLQAWNDAHATVGREGANE